MKTEIIHNNENQTDDEDALGLDAFWTDQEVKKVDPVIARLTDDINSLLLNYCDLNIAMDEGDEIASQLMAILLPHAMKISEVDS